MLHKEEKLSLG